MKNNMVEDVFAKRNISIADAIILIVISIFLEHSLVDSSVVQGTLIDTLAIRYSDHGLFEICTPLILAGILYLERTYIQNCIFDKVLGMVSLFFGIMNAFGQQLYYTDHLPSSFLDLFFMLGYVVSGAIVFYHVAMILLTCFGRMVSHKRKEISMGGRDLFLLSFVIILFGWMVWMIPFYPGSADWDVYYPIAQYMNFIERSNQQPWFYSMIVGFFFKLGWEYADKNAGMYAYIMFRAIIMSLIYARMVVRLKEHGVPKLFVWGTVFYYAFVPVWGAYAKHGFKDTLGAAFFCWYMMALFDMVCLLKKGKVDLKGYINYMAATLLSCLIRHNCFYVALPVTIALTAAIVINRKKNMKKVLAILLVWLGIVLFKGYQFYIYNVMGIAGIPPVEAISVPLQQMARTARDNDDRLTIEEKKMISSMMDYDVLRIEYDPVIADPIKFDAYYRDTDVKDYLKLWIHLFWRFPKSYLEAAIAESYGYYSFVPDQKDETAGNRNCGMCLFGWTKDPRFDPVFTCDYIEITEPIRNGLEKWAGIWHNLPGFGLLDVEAVYTWLIILVGIFLLRGKKYKELIAVFAMLLMVFSCCLSPVNDCFRYYAPIAASSPLLFLLVKGACKDSD